MTTIPAKNTPPWTLMAVFGLLALAISWVGYGFYQGEEQQLVREEYEELHIVADLKVAQIVAWRQERLADAHLVAASPFLSEHLNQLMEHPLALPCRSQLLGWIEMIKKQYQYQSVLLLNAQGKILLAAADSQENLDERDSQLIVECIRQPRVLLSDFYRCPDGTS